MILLIRSIYLRLYLSMLLWMIIIFDLSGQKTKDGRSMPFWTQRGFDHPRNPVSFCALPSLRLAVDQF